MGVEILGRIDPAAFEVTRTALSAVPTLRALKQSCENERQRLSQLRDTLRDAEAFREAYLTEDLEPLDPEHVNYRELYLQDYHLAQMVLSGWFHGMPSYADKLASLRKSIDAGLAAIGDDGCRVVERFLARRQSPRLPWGGYPKYWEVWTVSYLAERVVDTLTESFAHKPYDGSGKHWRETIRRNVSGAIHATEVIGRILQSDDELRNLRGELASDLAELDGEAVPDVQTVAHRENVGENGGNFQPAGGDDDYTPEERSVGDWAKLLNISTRTFHKYRQRKDGNPPAARVVTGSSSRKLRLHKDDLKRIAADS